VKIVKVTTAYQTYVRSFYERRPRLTSASYAEQYAAFAFDSFGWADFWGEAMAPRGYNVHEVWANVEPMQRAWAREFAASADEDWIHSIPLAQIKAIQPEVLFMDEYTNFSASWIDAARRCAPSIRLVLGWCGAPFVDASVFSAYDVVLSNIPELVELFRNAGHESRHVNHAFDPRVLDRLSRSPGSPIHVSFIGQIERSANTHGARERLLSALASVEELSVFSPVERPTYSGWARAIAKRGLYDTARAAKRTLPERVVRRIPLVSRAARWTSAPARPVGGALGKVLHPPVFGLDMFDTLRRSAVTLNCHTALSKTAASNMRMYEATGVGTCLVTDHRESLHALFDPDREVVTYRSIPECLEKVSWLRDHQAERNAIAVAGQRRTLADHTFNSRAPLLDDIIRHAIR
jgi:spore maturation protein CgeB